MIVTIKSKDGYKVDVSRLYFQALAKEITVEEYKNELDLWFKDNKSSQGSDEWNIKIDRGIDLTEIMNDL